MNTDKTSKTAFLPYLCSAVFLGGLFVLFFHRLADRDLWASHEGRAAQDAQSLLDDGFGALPSLYDGRPELQKPPLYYWLVALAAKAGGGRVDAWAVRLPAALAATACVALVFFFLWRRGRPIAGVAAAAVLATAVHFTWLARVGRIDMPLTLTTAAALVGFSLRGRWLLVAYLAVAAGLMLKGPIGAVLPAAVLVPLWVGARCYPPDAPARAWGLSWGVPLVLALVVPVYVWAEVASGGEFFRVFLWHHNVQRGFSGSPSWPGHPWWFYLVRFLGDFLPWSLAFPVALWLFARRGGWREDAEARFGLAWFALILLLLSAMRFKRADYLLPAYPGCAVFLGCVAERVYARARRPRRLAAAFAAAVGLCVVGWPLYLHFEVARREPTREHARFAAAIRRLSPAPRPVLFFRCEAHALAFHVGRPLRVFVEWGELDAWAGRPDETFVVLPPDAAAEWPLYLKDGRLEEVSRDADLPGAAGRERPLVLMRTRPNAASTDP